MAKFTDFKNGQFSWVDLNSRDQAKAKEFYSKLFGWEAKDEPIPQGGTYTMFLYKGEAVAGCGQMMDDMKTAGTPSIWMSYIRTDDVDGIAKKVKSAGGSAMMEPMDVMDEGRMGIFTDPTGAAFGAWQPKNHKGAGLCNEPNTFCWNELNTRDMGKAKEFYEKVWGWTWQETDMPDGGTYMMINNDGDMNAGAMAMIGPQWEGVPPSWSTYFAVANIEESVQKVKDLGGELKMGPMEAGPGIMALVSDPMQGMFTMIQMKEQS